MDDSIFDGRHDKCAGLEDLSKTPRMGSGGKHVPGVRSGSHPSKWNPRGELISRRRPEVHY